MLKPRFRDLSFLLLVLFLLLGLTGCQLKERPGTPIKPQPQIYTPISKSSLDGVTIKPLGTYKGYFQDAPAPLWSPSGNEFAYTVDITKGIAELGTLNPFHVQQIHLGSKRHIVSLSDHYAIVASSTDQENWLYPLKNNGRLGQAEKWNAPTDTWQEWVVTNDGPAAVTGGYQKDTLSLTFASGKQLPLLGGEVYLSPDDHFGAVVSRSREKRVVHPSGGINVPTRTQPVNVKDPITLWNFDASKGPKRVTTIKLNDQALPKTKDNANIQGIAFSPNNQEIAILINSENGGSQLTGQVDIFNVQSGKLTGTTSYGNGFVWLSGSQYFWLGTPYPKGQGYDRIVNIKGKTISSWEESAAYMVLPVDNQQVAEVVFGKNIGLAKPGGSFTAFPGINNIRLWSRASMSPGHKAALVILNKEMCILQY